MADNIAAFGITEQEAKKFALITAAYHSTLMRHISTREGATAITAAWVQATIEGVYRVTVENVKRVEAEKATSKPVDHLKGLRK